MATASLDAAFPAPDAAILSRVIDPQCGGIEPAVATAMLRWEFSSTDRQQMALLADRARDGTLTNDEQAEIDGYIRIGNLLSLIHAQANVSLKRQGSG